MIQRVSLFSPEKLFGFCQGEDPDAEIFFHAQDFHRRVPGGPLPIVGERVEVGEVRLGRGGRPRTDYVRRLDPPRLRDGVLKSFDSNQGWGFIELDGESVFFHMSDRAESWMPVINSRIQFFVGYSKGRIRACYARPIRALRTVSVEDFDNV